MNLVNNTTEPCFDIFDSKYSNRLLEKFPHLDCFDIFCVNQRDYLKMNNVPIIQNMDDTPFSYAINPQLNEYGRHSTWIIFNESVARTLKLSNDEMISSIAHEMGHVINYNNQKLIGASPSFEEVFADEIPLTLGLGLNLKSALLKLHLLKQLEEAKKIVIEQRIRIINMFLQN